MAMIANVENRPWQYDNKQKPGSCQQISIPKREVIFKRNIFLQAIPGIFLKIQTTWFKEKRGKIAERTIVIQLLPGISLGWNI